MCTRPTVPDDVDASAGINRYVHALAHKRSNLELLLNANALSVFAISKPRCEKVLECGTRWCNEIALQQWLTRSDHSESLLRSHDAL
jgi:hypothetical protein